MFKKVFSDAFDLGHFGPAPKTTVALLIALFEKEHEMLLLDEFHLPVEVAQVLLSDVRLHLDREPELLRDDLGAVVRAAKRARDQADRLKLPPQHLAAFARLHPSEFGQGRLGRVREGLRRVPDALAVPN